MNTRAIEKPIRRLRKLLRRGWRSPTPHEIHALRTMTRRYAATLAALHFDDRRNERHSLQVLERIRGRAGKIRDYDVLTSMVRTLEVAGEQDCLVILLEHLGAERVRRVHKLRRLIHRKRQLLRRRLKRAGRRLKQQLNGGNGGRPVQTAAQVLAAAVARTTELAIAERLNRQTLHAYRLKLKELRDVLLMTGGERDERFTHQLRKVKDAIGEWHDWERLAAIARTPLAAKHPDCAVARQIKATADAKYKRAFAMANRIRRQLSKHRSARTDRRGNAGLKLVAPPPRALSLAAMRSQPS